MVEKKHHAHRSLRATVAKMHAIYGKRLRQEDYSALMSCTSVADAAGYLKKNTRYSQALANVDTDTIHRGNLENILRKSLVESYIRMTGFEHIDKDEFYNYLIIKTEIDEILICIQHLNAGTDDHITTLPIYMNRYTCFNLMELAQVRSFDELMTLIEKTPYGELIREFRPEKDQYGKEALIDYAGCELKLRTYYSKRIFDSLEGFDRDTQDRLRAYIGTQIDIINIINSFRMTKYFNADQSVIKQRMIPVYQKIPERTLDALYGARDEKEFIRLFSDTCYGREIAARGYDMKNPEMALAQLKFKQTKRAFSSSQSAPECFFTFFNLAETELRNIIRIIEGIRYSLPVKEISELIIT